MPGNIPSESAIVRSEQLRERLQGMKLLVEGFSAELIAEIQILRDEMEHHQKGAGDDSTGASH